MIIDENVWRVLSGLHCERSEIPEFCTFQVIVISLDSFRCTVHTATLPTTQPSNRGQPKSYERLSS
jgi:hypothetical protein